MSELGRLQAVHRRALGLFALIAVVACTAESPPGVTPSPITAPATATVGGEQGLTPVDFERGQSDHEPPDLAAKLDEVLAANSATYGLVVALVPTGEEVRRNQTREFRSASAYKALLALVVLQQVEAERLSLEQIIVVTEPDAAEPEPAGGLAPGESTSVRGALEAMMRVSSNAAAFALLRQLGRSAFNRALRDLGLSATRVPLLNDESPRSGDTVTESVTTPEEMAEVMGRIAQATLLQPLAQMELEMLLRLPEELDAVVSGLPAEAEVYTKIGELSDAINVAGWVQTRHGPVVISLFSEGTDPGSARLVIGEVAIAAYTYFNR